MTTDRSTGEWTLAVRQHEAVARIGQIGLRSRDLDEVLGAAMEIAAETLGLEHLALFELEPGGEVLRGRVAVFAGVLVTRRRMGRVELPVGPDSLPGYVIGERTSVVCPDLLGDDRFRALAVARGFDVRAAVASPISWEDHPWGALVVYDRDLRAWTDDEVHLVQSVANTMGLAIQRAAVERELRDSSTRLDISLGAGGLGLWSWEAAGDRLTFNGPALEMFGLRPETYSGIGADLVAVVHPDERSAFAGEPGPGAAEVHSVFRIIRPDTGEVRWIEGWGRAIGDGADGVVLVGVCSDITERRRAEQLQAEMLQREHAARVAAEEARERLAFLSDASALLSASLDLDETLRSFADLCVPFLADVCLIDLVDDDDKLVERAAHAVDEESLANVRELRRRRAALGGVGGVYSERSVAESGQAVVHTTITDEDYQRASVDDEHLAVFRAFHCHSAVVAPLTGRTGLLGVLSLQLNREGRSFDAEDLALVEQLAARAALALDNSRLFHSRNRVARSLQAALLPPALPSIAGIGLAARYDVSEAEADVAIGGDFYDVIPVAPGSWGMVVGDVCGRGPAAAALTGLVRHTLRSAVVREHVPSRVLAQTNQAMLQQIDDARFCTAAYVRVDVADPPTGRLSLVASSAGHPPPILVRADGRAEALDCSGTLLGVVADPDLPDLTVELGPGDALVLYTDGVTEARRGNELFGEPRLIETLGSLAGRSAEAIAGGLERAVADFRRSARDDTAILVIQALPPA
ncbi:MAG: domain S-box protein [Ilumatobacteraceae bacterium]|nr:domain S-box protein [Ilumatobacteraceae bacterium]